MNIMRNSLFSYSFPMHFDFFYMLDPWGWAQGPRPPVPGPTDQGPAGTAPGPRPMGPGAQNV